LEGYDDGHERLVRIKEDGDEDEIQDGLLKEREREKDMKGFREDDVGEDDVDEEEAALGVELDMEMTEGWEGGFEKPDRAEMLVGLGSLGLVILLALAAGLTTVYDWVL